MAASLSFIAVFDRAGRGRRGGHAMTPTVHKLTGGARMGSCLSTIRVGLGLTLPAAALRRIGVSRQTLARVEQGERWLDPILEEQVIQPCTGILAEGRQATK